MDQVKFIKMEESKFIVQERDIKGKWKQYFQNLFNEGYEIYITILEHDRHQKGGQKL